MTRIILALALSFAMLAPAQALFDPPKGCRATPPLHTYQLHHTRNVGKICREHGLKGFGIVAGCTIWNRPDGKFAYDKPLVIVPLKGSFLYSHILRHELGHVVCPDWSH